MPCSLWWHPSHTFSCVFPLTWVCVLCPLTAPGHSADTESAINKCSLNERNSCISIPHLNLVSKKWSCRRNCRRWPPACLNFSYFVSIGIFFSFDSKAMFLLNKEMNQLPVFSKDYLWATPFCFVPGCHARTLIHTHTACLNGHLFLPKRDMEGMN